MRRFLTEWTAVKAFSMLFSVLLFSFGMFAVIWEPEAPERGSLVIGDPSAPVEVVELADFT